MEVVELFNAFGVLVIHLDGKEVYVIYIYTFFLLLTFILMLS